MIDLDSMIKRWDKDIIDWADEFHKKTEDYNIKSGNVSYILYERTLSSKMNVFINSFFDREIFKCFMVNEFAVKNCTITPYDRSLGKSETGVSSKDWEKYCIFDGYFHPEDLKNKFVINGISFEHFFIEYKLDNKFVFLKFATDYLKFKLFTKNISNNCSFCYCIFDKDESKPSITNLYSYDKRYYYLIEKSISEESLPISNVYIYVPNTSEKKDISTDVISSITTLDKVVSEAKDIDLTNQFTSDENELISLASRFKRNVMISKLILKNYSYIKDVWKAANEKHIFDNYVQGDIASILIEGAQYNKNLENYLNSDRRELAERDGLNTSYKTSINYLAIIDYFANECLDMNFSPNYFSKKINHGKNEKI